MELIYVFTQIPLGRYGPLALAVRCLQEVPVLLGRPCHDRPSDVLGRVRDGPRHLVLHRSPALALACSSVLEHLPDCLRL